MPLVKRKVRPIYLSRRPTTCGLSDADYDATSVTNVTLCGAISQLGSLLKIAEEIKNGLENELLQVYERTKTLTSRFVALEAEVLSHNPRKVTVPESDLKTFSERIVNFRSRDELCGSLFTAQTRPIEIQKMYDEAVYTPKKFIDEVDKFRSDANGDDSLKKAKIKKLNLDIETRRPASFVVLRDWGSDDETLESEVDLAPVSPAVPLRPPPAPHPADLKLPLPEQRLLALSCKYPPQLIPIDVSGRGFRRMELFRQSLIQFEYVKGKRRRRRVKRRNTIADAREIRSSIKHKNLPSTSSGHIRSSRSGSPSSRGAASSYTDRSFDTTLDTSSTKTANDRELHHHFLGLDVSLPNPPKNVFTISRHLTSNGNSFRERDFKEEGTRSSSGNWSGSSSPRTSVESDIQHTTQLREPEIDESTIQPKESDIQHTKELKELNIQNTLQPLEPDTEHIIHLHQEPDIENNSQSFISDSENTLQLQESDSENTLQLQESDTENILQIVESEIENNSQLLKSDTEDTSQLLKFDINNSLLLQGSNDYKSLLLESDIDNVNPIESVIKEHSSDFIESIAQPEAVNEVLRPIPVLHTDVEEIKEFKSLLASVLTPIEPFDQDSFISDSFPVQFSSPTSHLRTNSQATDEFPSSFASDGTVTPTQDIRDIPFFDDDSSSAFSCDTEGYYTSFHIDSGIRSVSCNKLSPESELVSTGTNSSVASLGTVIMRNPEKKTPPKPPQRVSSLERKENRESIITVIHINGSTSSREDLSEAQSSSASGPPDGRGSSSSKECDSGRETATSTTESTSPRQQVVLPIKSELPAVTPRQKSSINAIPSMCVITPPQSDEEKSNRELSGVQRKIQNFQASLNATGSPPALPVRQPGDGAVAPSISPSQQPSGPAPSLTVMSHKRLEKDKNFSPAVASQPLQKKVDDHLSLSRTVSVSERRAEIQQKVSGEKKPSSDGLHSRQNSKDSDNDPESTNLISYKELPASTSNTAVHPYSSVPSNVKQNAVITPTNSLERRKGKGGGAHVTLDSEGKVVYSSDSLPRRKSHSSFEPGPYIKPPPISSNGTQSKPKTASSIQNMPLPPVPSEKNSSAQRREVAGEVIYAAGSTTPQQPKLGTRSQGSPNVISQTLSGLSAHMQPRTISQINSLRSKSPMNASAEKSDNKFHTLRSKSLEQGDKSQYRSSTLPRKHLTATGHEDKPPQSLVKEDQNYHSLQRQPAAPQNSGSQLHQQQQNLQYQQALQHQQVIQKKNIQHQQAIQQQSLSHQPKTQRSGSLPSQQLKLQQTQEHQLKLQQLKQEQEQQVKNQQQEQQLKTQKQEQQLKIQQQEQQLKIQQQEQQLKIQQQEQKLLQQQQKQQILQQQHMQLQQQLQQQQAQLQQHKAQKEQAKKNAKVSQMDSIYETRQDLQRQQLMQLQQQQMLAYQQPIYPTQEELYMARQHMLQQQQQQQQQQQRSQMGPTEVIMGTQGTPSPSQQLYGTTPALDPSGDPTYSTRPQGATGHPVGTTSRAPTPIQGLSTSSPQRLPALQHQNLRTQQGLVTQRSAPGSGSSTPDGRGTPIPGTMTPANYEQYNLTNSDIYGRIGMTRQVQVGGPLAAAFGRNQRVYSSLPPNLRQTMTPSEVLGHQGTPILRQNTGSKTLTRRASVAGTDSNKMTRPHANNADKAVDKKVTKAKKKKKEEVKPESKKKKWFWTLPIRRKKKNKDEASEDDEGGFNDNEQKSSRKSSTTTTTTTTTAASGTGASDTSFIRYPSPDTGSSDMNSSYSSDVSSSEHGYRSSSSSEVYYYSQMAQHQQQQIVQMRGGAMSAGLPTSGTTPVPAVQGQVPRSQPTTPVSPPESLVSVDTNDITDLTQRRRYMSRDEMYAAMRHPQYYNNRNSVSSSEVSQNSTPASSRSNSPAVFGVNPVPPYVVRPQVREGFSIWSGGDTNSLPLPKVSQSSGGEQPSSLPAKLNDKEETAKIDILPPYPKDSLTPPSSSPPIEDNNSTASANAKVVAKQTTLNDFKKMILNKSMKAVGGKERISAVEMLRVSRPSIYGFSPPPPPLVVKELTAPSHRKDEGIIIPPSSRNTARALLFQSRFGSGRRFRAHKTEIISTTIIEDRYEDEFARLQQQQEDEEDSDDEDLSSSTTSSQERRSVTVTESKTPNGVTPKGIANDARVVATSTPNKENHPHPHDPNVSMIVSEDSKLPSREAQETSL